MSLLCDIEKRAGDFRLKVAFEANDNEVLALLGASGCGKSMTLKCIAGIERPDRGRIVLDGRTLFDKEKGIDLPPQERRVGYLFQQYALFPNMTVEKNIACGVRDKSQRGEKVKEMIALMGLSGTEKLKPAQLSGGQQQRVALARILVNEPDLLLLDEPFSALDSHLRFRLEQEVRSAIARFRKTTLLVSHDRDEVFRISTHIAVMNDGHIETRGEKHAVFRAPMTVNGARLTGCKNILPVRAGNDGTILIGTPGLALKAPHFPKGARFAGIRMHDILLSDDANDENRILCRVTDNTENPFSVTLRLCPADMPEHEGFCTELPKDEWERHRSETVAFRIPADAPVPLTE
ncbi:MAG: sulfate/molybdate ABC transporter ATP-binding protein [Clostridia bacterium]|nr:sulfate/molybdate ABC transporter ATP-binding protein [Clostridia bacterium]